MRFHRSSLGALALLFLCLCSAHANTPQQVCVNWQPSDFTPTPEKNSSILAPDYGLYWFKDKNKNGAIEETAKAYTPKTLEPLFSNGSANTAPGPNTLKAYKIAKNKREKALEKNGFFNPNAPTMIIVHGWQPENTVKKYRFSFCYHYKVSDIASSPTYDTLKYWKNKGWNIAVIYWNQFADELNVRDAESKIYPGVDPLKRRWAYLNSYGELEYCDDSLNRCMKLPKNAQGNTDSITDLAYLMYKNALPKNYHQQIRIAGFSLGTQVAIQLTDKIVNDPGLPQPNRLVLLDPFFSTDPLPRIGDIGRYNANSLLDIINKTNGSIGISMYRSSPFSNFAYQSLMVKNVFLKQHIAYTRLHPKYLIGTGLELMGEEHISAPYLYFQSMRAKPRWSCKSKGHCTWDSYINAAATRQQLFDMTGLLRFQQPSKTHQSERNFPNTQDDIFSKLP